MGRACVELSSAWLQLACRQDQREPQFALTLGCKTQHDHNNTQLQLVRVYIDIGSVACVDGEAAEAMRASCWMFVMARLLGLPALFWATVMLCYGHDQATQGPRTFAGKFLLLVPSNVVALQDRPARR